MASPARSDSTTAGVDFRRRAIALLLPTAVTSSAAQALIPAVAGMLNRTDAAEEAISGFAVAFAIAVLVGLPQVRTQQLTLVFFNDSRSLPVIRLFVLRWAGLTTTVMAVVALTPLNGLVLGSVFSVEPEVEKQAAGALRAMVLLPGLLTIRAHLHGVALRAERPRVIWAGTIAGSATVIGIAAALIFTESVDGATAAGIAFSAGVGLEAVLVWLLMRRVVITAENAVPVRMADMVKFFWPLLVAAIAPSITQPIVNAGMARAEDATVSIAAVAIAFGLFQTVSAATNGVQNSSLALMALGFGESRVLRFMLSVGAITTAATMLIGFVPPVTSLVLKDILGTDGKQFDLALFAFRLLAALPLVVVVEQFFAATLMRARNTRPIIIINLTRLAVLGLWVTLTVALTDFTGAAVGAGAIALTLLIEGVMTHLYGRRGRSRGRRAQR